MPHALTNPVIMVYVGEAVLLLLCGAFILVVFYSHGQKLRLQEENLREIKMSEENYKTLFHNSLAGMLKFNYRNFEILDANHALLKLFVCDSMADLSETLKETVSDHLQAMIRALEECGILEEYELSFRDKTGSVRWLLVSVKSAECGKIAHGVFRDITRRKADHEKIEELAALLNKTKDSVIVLTLEGEIMFWNIAATEIYGWESNAVTGKKIQDLIFPPDEQYRICVEDVLHFGEWSGEQTHLTNDQRLILVASSWQKIDNRFTNSPTLLVVSTDITEKRALELQAVYNQKMEAIALMTSGIAHDLQNILAPVALSVNILRNKVTDHSGNVVLSKIEESTQNGLRLVKNIFMAGKGISGMKKPVELSSVLESTLRTFSHHLTDAYSIEKHINRQHMIVAGDESQLGQVFLNLFQNAKNAMPLGGKLFVSLGEDKPVAGGDSSSEQPLLRGTRALVTISDTGHGIAPEYLEKIFEPFFTTKEGSGGTGLGLPIVRNIIRNHNGSISVESEPGKGTTFYLSFPLCQSEEGRIS